MTENLCPKCKDTLALDARACACGWRISARGKPAANTNCACGQFGIVKRDGEWKCATHAGFERQRESTGPNYRERWYAERGLPYEPPKLGDLGFFRCIGRAAEAIVMREPGEDLDEVA